MFVAFLLLNPNCLFFADYHGFTRDHRNELEEAFKFLGTEDPSQALDMLQCDFIAYGLHSKFDQVIGADGPQSHPRAEPPKPPLPDPHKENNAFIQNTQDMVSKILPDQLHGETFTCLERKQNLSDHSG
jgi:hypothetical protein